MLGLQILLAYELVSYLCVNSIFVSNETIINDNIILDLPFVGARVGATVGDWIGCMKNRVVCIMYKRLSLSSSVGKHTLNSIWAYVNDDRCGSPLQEGSSNKEFSSPVAVKVLVKYTVFPFSDISWQGL